MKFTLFVEHADSGRITAEGYNKGTVKTLKEAKEWSKVKIKLFNKSLRPNEEKRIFVDVVNGIHSHEFNAGKYSIQYIKERADKL